MRDARVKTRPPQKSTLVDPAVKSLLSVCDLRRSFGETSALVSCTLDVRAGEIHALVGENGSGKSTLIKILSGVLQQDAGTLTWRGVDATFADPKAAQRAGIATVFQETLSVEELSVCDNILLGLDGVVRRAATPRREAELASAALAEVGLATLDIEAPMLSLSLAQRQLVTIARAFARPWRLLILDESTSALDVDDRDRLFEALARLRGEERSILFVSHRMDEIAAIAHRVTVLRSGRNLPTLSAGEASTERLLELMSTREEAKAAEGRARSKRVVAPGRPVLTVEALTLRASKAAFDLSVAAGEILGIAGLEGHGGVAFIECLAGLAPAAHGAIRTERGIIRSPRDAARSGVAFVPRDRKRDGIFPPLSVLDNVVFPILPRFARSGFIRRTALQRMTSAIMERMRLKATRSAVPIATLSGGNQQKVLLGRWIATEPRTLVLNDPMRGVDQGTKLDLYDVLHGLAANGMAIVFLSTELPELCFLCDRVAVFREHTLAAVIERDAVSERTLIAAMFGHAAAAEVAG